MDRKNLNESLTPRNYEISYRPRLVWDAKLQRTDFTTHTKLTHIIDKFVWSPIIFKDGVRTEKNFLYADWCVFDFDEHYPIEQAAKDFIDYRYIIAPTKSHTEIHHRYRICIPFAHRISDLYQYRYNMQKLVEQFSADPQCKDGARFFWPSKFVYHVNWEGEEMPVSKAPLRRIFKPHRRIRPTEAVISDRLLERIERTYHVGERNQNIWIIAKELYRAGFDWQQVRSIIGRINTQPRLPENELDQINRSAKKAIENEEGKGREDQLR